VEVEGEVVGKIGPGLVVFAAVGRDDTEQDGAYIADKLVHLRLFEDEAGQINLSVQEVGGSILAVSNFTVYGDCRKGRRPSFTQAAPPDVAEARFARLVEHLRATGVPVAEGRFGARMRVSVENDGPVTVLLDSKKVI
jgi:D-tyrosyl-tRNA(Tyr) deacylase